MKDQGAVLSTFPETAELSDASIFPIAPSIAEREKRGLRCTGAKSFAITVCLCGAVCLVLPSESLSFRNRQKCRRSPGNCLLAGLMNLKHRFPENFAKSIHQLSSSLPIRTAFGYFLCRAGKHPKRSSESLNRLQMIRLSPFLRLMNRKEGLTWNG